MGCVKKERPLHGGLKRRWVLRTFLPVALTDGVLTAAIAITAAVLLPDGGGCLALAVCGLGLAVAAALWFLGGAELRRTTDALQKLTEQTHRITEGSFGMKTEALRSDEIGALAGEINALSEQAAASSRLQREFISSVSHELRTPLTAVIGWAEALSYDEAIQGDSRRGVEIIARESGRLTKMVEELLEFTRIQDGRFQLSMETIDLAAEVEDTVFTFSRLLEQDNLTLHCDCDDDLPMMEGDPERLRQVLLNLLDNASKYGREGKTIELSLHADGSDAVITVRDHGPGIPEAELPRVKEKFYKGSGKERGSGIGLAVCEEIITRHGGSLTIANAEGGGTAASVRLPLPAPKTE